MTTLPPGHKANLGTDLSDDHPISFKYDAALATKDPKLRHPTALPPAMKLDAQQELQCTTCHDPHLTVNPKFLKRPFIGRTDNVCLTCHIKPGWSGSNPVPSSSTTSSAPSASPPDVERPTGAR
mgnify:CR=1 FL=1